MGEPDYTGVSEYTFACCFVGSRPEDYGEMKYDLPDNVVHLEVHYLHDQGNKTEKKASHGNQKMFENVDRFHRMVRSGRVSEERNRLFTELIGELGDGGALSEEAFLHSRSSWDLISRAIDATAVTLRSWTISGRCGLCTRRSGF